MTSLKDPNFLEKLLFTLYIYSQSAQNDFIENRYRYERHYSENINYLNMNSLPE